MRVTLTENFGELVLFQVDIFAVLDLVENIDDLGKSVTQPFNTICKYQI